MKRKSRAGLEAFVRGASSVVLSPWIKDALDSDARQRAEIRDLRAMLKRLEFSEGPGGLMHPPEGKCPVCLGFDGSTRGNGETRKRHRANCELAALLKKGKS
jgi:hypothetical protein